MPIVSLTTFANYNSLATDINIVGTFSSDSTLKFTDKHVSAPLLNYVEPYLVDGVEKTLFFTEVNSNVKVGDRVFIINGNYDSNELILKNKYKKGTDGYIVLFVDRCKVVLDIDYTGVLPNNNGQTPIDTDFIRVYYMDSYDRFVTANRQLTTRGGYIGSKFDYYQNNVIFVDYDYDPIRDGWTRTTGITASPGFYVREPAYDPLGVATTKGEVWRNITNEIMSGSFSVASSDMNPKTDLRYYNNNKMLIMERDFSFRLQDYREGNVYTYNPTLGRWVVEVKLPGTGGAILTRTNFRDGDFEGSFYSGVYGRKDKRIKWTGKGTWYGGTLFNSSWVSGSMFSTIALPESWKATLDRERKGTQKQNTENNGGYGWNYVLESEFESTSIYSSIVRRTKFGMTPSLPVVENYINSVDTAFDHVLNDGLFESCYFSNTKLIGGAVKNSRSTNTLMQGVKHINSWAKDTVFNNSTLIADSNIKILGYDEWTASERRGSSTYGDSKSDDLDFKVYKLYIGEADFFKLKSGDSFYVRGIRIENDPFLLNLFDRKFTFGSWTEYVDEFSTTNLLKVPKDHFYKKGIVCAAFLVNPEENEHIFNSVETATLNQANQFVPNGYITDTIVENPNALYSIDIFVSTKGLDNIKSGKIYSAESLDLNYPSKAVDSLTYIRPDKLGDRVDISNAFIIDSHIESGLIDKSYWNQGYDISYNNDLVITPLTNSTVASTYDAVKNEDGTITFTTLTGDRPEIVDRDSHTLTSDIKPNDVIFTSGLDYYSTGKVLSLTITEPGKQYADSVEPIYPQYSSASASKTGTGLSIMYTTVNSKIDTVTIITKGIDYKNGDVLYLKVDQQGAQSPNIGSDAYLTITSVDPTPPVRLPDAWKVKSYVGSKLVAEPVYDNKTVLGLTESGLFRNTDANNRWGRFTRTKINSTRIKSGIFRRSSLTNNLIENETYDATDRDFNYPTKIKSLVVAEALLNNTGNKLSKATYFNSSITGGTDEWIDGIIYRSVLNKMTFNRGIIKESSWLDGTFNGGLFYSSRSFNATPFDMAHFFYDDRILSPYKTGRTDVTPYNDRYSWRKGVFNGGEFFRSDWEGGEFRGGLFHNSKWYGGTAFGGKFGKDSTATNETLFYGGLVEFTTVDNATFVSDDTSKTGVTSSILWKNGVFNAGVFGANRLFIDPTTSQAKSYEIAETTIPHDVKSIKEYSIVAAGNHTDIARIDINIEFESAQPLSNYRISLVSPSNNKILVKDLTEGLGNLMTDTIFTTDTERVSLSTGYEPYIGRFRFALGFKTTIVDKNYVSKISDLISTQPTTGVWKIEILNTNDVSTNVRFSAVISFFDVVQNENFIQNSAIWLNGIFNSGQFVNYAYWRDGVFNNGKFVSAAGWEDSGIYNVVGASYSHSWHNGTFNGGIFGNSEKTGNSTWYNGVFNNGTFVGRLWNHGIFKNGIFRGSGLTANGGWSIETVSAKSNAKNFVSDFETEFYGLWRNGLVTDRDDITLSGTNFTTQTPNSVTTNNNKIVSLESVLWNDGTFDHKNATMYSSVWLAGTFSNGTFNRGTFNPYVNRNGSQTTTFNESTKWNDGTLIESDFFFSEWNGGKFISGTAVGMWFRHGTSFYMNAYNVLWGDKTTSPVWKNGNWFGSEFRYLGGISDDMIGKILDTTSTRNRFLNMSDLGFNSRRIHVWNIFEDASVNDTNFLGINADAIDTRFDGYTPENDVLDKNYFSGALTPPTIWES